MRRPPERPLTDPGATSLPVCYPQAVLAWLAPASPALLRQRSVQLWHAIHEELSAIIGESGFVALYNRCIELGAHDAPWLERITARDATLLSFEALGTCLASRPAAEAMAASGQLFAHFYALLLLLIGPSLTDGVLDAAWRDRLAAHLHPIPDSLRGTL